MALRLIRFLPQQSFLRLDTARPTIPSFPFIQKLFLNVTSLHGSDFVRLCPNVSLVSIFINQKRWHPSDSWDDSYGNLTSGTLHPKWNTRRSLVLSSTTPVYIPQSLLGTAFHLRVECKVNTVALPDGSDTLGAGLLLAILRIPSLGPVVGGYWRGSRVQLAVLDRSRGSTSSLLRAQDHGQHP